MKRFLGVLDNILVVFTCLLSGPGAGGAGARRSGAGASSPGAEEADGPATAARKWDEADDDRTFGASQLNGVLNYADLLHEGGRHGDAVGSGPYGPGGGFCTGAGGPRRGAGINFPGAKRADATGAADVVETGGGACPWMEEGVSMPCCADHLVDGDAFL